MAIAILSEASASAAIQHVVEKGNWIRADILRNFHELGNVEQALAVFVFGNKRLRAAKPVSQHGL